MQQLNQAERVATTIRPGESEPNERHKKSDLHALGYERVAWDFDSVVSRPRSIQTLPGDLVFSTLTHLQAKIDNVNTCVRADTNRALLDTMRIRQLRRSCSCFRDEEKKEEVMSAFVGDSGLGEGDIYYCSEVCDPSLYCV